MWHAFCVSVRHSIMHGRPGGGEGARVLPLDLDICKNLGLL